MNDTITLAMATFGFLIQDGESLSAEELARRIRAYNSHTRSWTIAREVEASGITFTRYAYTPRNEVIV